MTNIPKYEKVSRYNLKGNRNNFLVFLAEIHEKPIKGIGLGIIFMSLAVAILLVDSTGSVKFGAEWKTWGAFSISTLAALFFFYHAFFGSRKRTSDDR